MCYYPSSVGYHWIRGNSTNVVCQSKRPGSSMADDMGVGVCYAKYNRNISREYLEEKEECIYQTLVLGFDDIKVDPEIRYGTRVILTFM